MTNTIYTTMWHSPLGRLKLGSIGDRLCLCGWAESPRRVLTDRLLCRRLGAVMQPGRTAVTETAMRELGDYFAGRRRTFDVPLRLTGTPFQLGVWHVLRSIPFGATMAYRDEAAALGRPRAVRAVGAANGANPLVIFVPCHRVVGAAGTLTGYTGGLHLKAGLLHLEGVGA